VEYFTFYSDKETIVGLKSGNKIKILRRFDQVQAEYDAYIKAYRESLKIDFGISTAT